MFIECELSRSLDFYCDEYVSLPYSPSLEEVCNPLLKSHPNGQISRASHPPTRRRSIVVIQVDDVNPVKLNPKTLGSAVVDIVSAVERDWSDGISDDDCELVDRCFSNDPL